MIQRGVIGYLVVLAGGLVISVIPASSWVATVPVVSTLRAGMDGRMLGLTVVVAGLGLAATAWLQLLRCVARGDRADERDRVRLVRRATALWSLPLLLAPPMFSRDGWSYAAQGQMTRLGLNPYVWTPSVLEGPIVEAVDPQWMDTLTPYGPLPLLWGALAARFTDDPWLLVVAHRLLALAGVVLLLYAVPRLAGWAHRDQAVATALAVPSPLVLCHGVAGVHNDVLMVGLAALALVVARERRSWVAGAAVTGLAAAVKLPGGVVGIGVALLSLTVVATTGQRVRRLVQVALVAVGVLWFVGVVGGVGHGWIHALAVPGEVRTPLSAATQLGRLLGVVLASAGASVDVGVAVTRLVGEVVALAVIGHLALRAPVGVPAAAVRSVGLAMLAVVVLGPVVHHWYLLWFVPLLAACHLGRRASSTLVVTALLPGLVGPLDSSLDGAGTLITLGVALTAAMALWLTRVHRQADLDLPRASWSRAARKPRSGREA